MRAGPVLEDCLMKSVYLCQLRRSLPRSPSGFARNESGTVAVLFALLLVPMLGLVFAGIDYSRAMTVQSQFQTAAEAAAISAASRLPEGTEEAKGAFEAAFKTNLPEELRDQPYELEIAGDNNKLEVAIKAKVPTTLVAILGVSKLDVSAKASAERPLPNLFARGKKGGAPLAALPQGAAGAKARAQIERAMRRSGGAGLADAKMPDPREVEAARRKIENAMRANGVPANLPRNIKMPDPAEVERMHRMIARELGSLRF